MHSYHQRSHPAQSARGEFSTETVWAISSRLRWVLSLLGLLILGTALAPAARAASCDYLVEDEWNNGFKAKVTVNNGAEPVDGWQVNWTWADGATLNNGWNASFDCAGSSCTVGPPAWKNALAANEPYSFGFTASKGSAAPTEIPVLGGVCDGSGGGVDLWQLDAAQSTLHYVSVKKDHIAETNTFASTDGDQALTGTVDAIGNAILAIDLNSVSTGVDIRNSRLLALLFETDLLPTAYFHASVDIDAVAAMDVGAVWQDTLTGEFSLHGARQPLSAEVLIAKLAEDAFSVSTLIPLVIDSKAFDMAAGIEALRLVANLSSIGEAVPVYFNLTYRRSTDAGSQPVAMPEAPLAPSQLAGAFDANSAEANLDWQDNSDVETHFLVRRRPADGSWETVAELAPDSTFLTEGLPDEGEFDYKVIALNQGVPSAPSNTERVSVTAGNQLVRGQETYATQCAGCHGAQGQGTADFPAVDQERDLETLITYIADNMPFNNASACDTSCAEDVAAFIQTLWVEETACNLQLSPVSYGARQLKLLTAFEYQNSVRDLLGVDFDITGDLSADTKIGFFFNNTHTAVTEAAYSNYLLVAEEIAQWSAEQGFSPAMSCSGANGDCVNQLVDELAPRIFRRPLDDNEKDTYRALADGSRTAGDIEAGLRLALEALLSSPQFLYRHELGEPNPDNPEIDTDAFELTSFEMATFLAYTFTASTPDPELLDAAANDELRDRDNILAQAQRLASSARGTLANFLGNWLGTIDLELAAKDVGAWPGFPLLVPHMQAEINEMFAHVMLDPNERFASLYAADYTFLNGTLAAHYGLPGVAGDNLQRVTTTDRGGILANGAFMARWGESLESSPILRSVRVRRRMLCQDQPDPPAGTFEAREQKLAELSDFLMEPTTTNRMKYHRLTEDSPCTTCHLEYINPLGFGMEDFDTVGRVRSTDVRGNPIDASGALFAPERYSDIGVSLPFVGTRELGTLLAQQPSAQSCLPQQLFRYVMGVGYQDINSADPGGPQLVSDVEKSGYACELGRLQQTMINDSPRAMLESFGALEAVRYRKAWARSAPATN